MPPCAALRSTASAAADKRYSLEVIRVIRLGFLSAVLFAISVASSSADAQRSVYTNFDAVAKPANTAIIVGRSVSAGPELVVLLNTSKGGVIEVLRSFGFNREQEFVLAVEPGTYSVHLLGAHGSPIGARDKSFSFSVSADESIYIGTFTNDWHRPGEGEVIGKVVESRIFGRSYCTKFLCSGYLDSEVRTPYTKVHLIDETPHLVDRLRAEVPILRETKVITRLAH